jgi:hypothetical protein
MIDLFGRTVCSLFQNSGVVLVMNKGMQAVWAAAAHVGPLAEHAMLRPGAMCFSHSNRLLPVVRAALSSRSMASSRSGEDKGPDKQARSREFLPGRPIQLRKIQLSRMGAGKRSGLILDNQRRERRKANEGLFGVFCAGGLLDRCGCSTRIVTCHFTCCILRRIAVKTPAGAADLQGHGNAHVSGCVLRPIPNAYSFPPC